MRVILLTDIHGETENLGRILEKEEYDAVLCAGDLSDANEYDDYERNLLEVIEEFEKEGKMTKAVPGNMDPEEECVRNLIQRRMNIHKKIASFEDFDAVGFGGGKTPFETPFEPEGEEIKNAISTLYDRMKSDNRVAVIHQPPKGVLDEVDGNNVGSEEVRELIEDKEFELMLTGHIHEARGRKKLEGTTVVNPGPVLEGFYAVAELHDGLELEMKQL